MSPKNVQTFEAVFNIGHCLGNILGSSWHILLEACEKLEIILTSYNDDGTAKGNLLAQSSSTSGSTDADQNKLKRDRSDSSLDGINNEIMGKEHVTILRFALDRLFESSVYLDAAGLKHMIQSLGVLAIESMSRVEFASPRESPVTVGYGNSSVRAKRKDQESRGGYVSAAFSTISRIAGRTTNSSNSMQGGNAPKQSRKPWSGDGEEGYGVFNKVPFAWKKLVAATVINVMRLDVIWELVSGHLETMCANKNEVMRAYGIQSMEKIICEALVYVSPTDGTADVNGTQDVGLAIGSASEQQVVNSKRFLKKCKLGSLNLLSNVFTLAEKDVQENAMNAVYDIIQNCGHVLREGWTVLLRLLSRVAKQHTDLVPLGFKSVQLIADDFLGNLHLSNENWNKDMSDIEAGADDQDSKSTMNQDDELPSPARVDAFLLCIECLSDYAMQVADVNISLTAIGTLWAVGDYARQQMTQATNVECDSEKKANAIWIIVLKQLKILSLNERGPVRNCALQTMFTTLVTHGEFFSTKTWRACIDIEGFVFNVIDGIERKCTLGMNEDAVPSNTGNNGGHEEDNYMIVHHSRDTLAKQWNETRVIAMKELSRTVRSFSRSLVI